MGETLQAEVELVNQKIKFTGRSKTNPPIEIDYVPPLGDGEGYMPLELVLISLASCFGGTMAPLLRRMNKNILKLKIKAQGYRREKHPTSFEKINLEIFLNSTDIGDEDITKAIKLAEETFCPVFAMLKGNVEINVKYSLIKEGS